jgi:hypothetical protein
MRHRLAQLKLCADFLFWLLARIQIACEPDTDPGKKYKEATKMVDIFDFIVGVFELRKFGKIQLVLGSSTNI